MGSSKKRVLNLFGVNAGLKASSVTSFFAENDQSQQCDVIFAEFKNESKDLNLFGVNAGLKASSVMSFSAENDQKPA
eukprot:Awhi_evm1s6540